MTHPLWAGILVILYPLWDVACNLYDLKTSEAGSVQDVANHQCSVRLRYRTRNCVHRLPSTRIRCHCLWPLGSRCWSASAWRRSDPAQAVGRSMGDDRERYTVNRCQAGLYAGWPQREISYQRSGRIRRLRRSVLPRGWNTTQSKALSAFFLASKGRNVHSLMSAGPLLSISTLLNDCPFHSSDAQEELALKHPIKNEPIGQHHRQAQD
jgi:hypothetical protein